MRSSTSLSVVAALVLSLVAVPSAADHLPDPVAGPYVDQSVAGDPECSITEFPGQRSLVGAPQRQSFVPSRGSLSHVQLCLTSTVAAPITVIFYERGSDGGLVEQGRVESRSGEGTSFHTVALPSQIAANAGEEYIVEVAGPAALDTPSAILAWRLTCQPDLLTGRCADGATDRYPLGQAADGGFGASADFGFRTLTPTTADLVGSFRGSPRQVCRGLSFPASLTVQNLGRADIRASTLRIELSAPGHPAVEVDATSLPAMGPGQRLDLERELVIPPAAVDGFDGRAELVLTVDAAGVVVESDEANNTTAVETVLTSCEPSSVALDLSADRPEVAAGVGELAVRDLPIATIPFGEAGLADAPLTQNPLTQNPLTQNPLTQNPLTQNPLTQNQIVDSPLTQNSFLFGAPYAVLRQITLPSIPLARPGGWQAVLDAHAEAVAATGSGSDPISHVPLQQLSLLDVMTLDPTPQPPILWAEMDLSATGLGGLVMAATALGATPLVDVPLPTGQPWCGFLLDHGVDCVAHEIDDTTATLVTANLLGLDMTRVPFADITMASVTLHSASPLATVSLQDANPYLEYDVRLTPWADVLVSGDVASLVDCAAMGCDATTTLAHVTQADAFVAGSTVADLLAALGEAHLGATTIGDAIRGTTRNVASLPLEGAHLGSVQLAALAPSGPFVTYSLSVAASVDGASLVDPVLTVTLPDGFAYVPGSGQLSGPDVAAELGEATVATTAALGDVVTFSPNLYVPSAGAPAVLTIQANAGSQLGTFTSSASASGHAVAGTYGAETGSAAPVTVVERFEPNAPEGEGQTWTQPPADTLVFSHIAEPGDLDTWSIPVPAEPGSQVKIVLSHLPADYDILLGSATANPLTQNPLTQNPLTQNPLTQNPLTQNQVVPEAGGEWHANEVGDTTQPETLQDLPLTQNPLTQNGIRAVSVERGDHHETIVIETVDGEAGTYPLVVAGYNGAASAQPYVLRYHVVAPRQFDLGECQPAPFPSGSGHEGTLPDPASLPVDTNVLYLVAQQRYVDAYSAEGLAQVKAEVDAVNAAGLGVRGVVLPVEGARWDGAANRVAAAYDAWDAARCDQVAINTVAGATRDLVLEYRRVLPIDHVVVVGDDDQVPFLRVRDDATLANERSFLSSIVAEDGIADLDGDPNNGAQPAHATPRTTALASGLFLTDDHLGTAQPRPWLDQAAWIPDIGLGRLPGDPATSVAALAHFRGSGGELDPDVLTPTDTVVAGYDHLADGSHAVADALDASLGSTAQRLIGEQWTRDEVAALLTFPDGADDVVASINGHAHQSAFLPALGNLLGDTTDLYTAADLAGALPAGSVILSMACHFGYDLATRPGTVRDWADAVAARLGVLVAPTGYSYGDTDTVAAGELFSLLLADNLDGTLSFGHAVALTKAQHHAREGAYSGEYFKSMQAMVTYGLPMYRVAGTQTSPPRPVEFGVPFVDPATGLLSVDLQLDLPIVASDADCPAGASCLVERTGANGTFYEVVGTTGYAPLAVSGRTLTPRATLDLSSLGDGSLRVHGAIVTAATSTDVTGVDPSFARAVVDAPQLEPEPQSLGTIFPTAPLHVGTVDTPLGEQQTLTVLPSTFRTTGLVGSTVVGDVRLDTALSVRLLLSDSADNVPGTIRTVQATRQGQDVAITVVTEDANAPMVAVVAMYRDHTGVWRRAQLTTDDGGTTWAGVGDLPSGGTDAADLLVQAIDADGDVAFYRRKGDLTPLGLPGDLVLSLEGSAGDNGWYRGPVTVTLPPLSEGEYQRREANDPFVAFAGNTFVVQSEGVHRIDILAPDGSRVDDLVIAIDFTPPTISLRSPEDGAIYPYDTVIRAEYDCSGFGPSGGGACRGDALSGTTLPRVVGSGQTFSVAASDGAGNAAQVTHTYTVLAPPIDFEGFFSPVVNGIWNEWDLSKQDSVPFKWRLYRGGELVTDTGVVTELSWQQVACSVDLAEASPTGPPVPAISADGNGIQVISRRMQFEAAPPRGAPGTCQRFDLVLEDGTVHQAWFVFSADG